MPGEIELKVYGLGSIGKVHDEVYLGLVVLFVVGSGFLLWKKGWREGLRASSVLLLVEWVFLILCTAVIFRESSECSRINLIPLSSYFDIAENSYLLETSAINILNVLMFVPVGLLLRLSQVAKDKGWLFVLAFGAGLSVLIELLQFILKRGLCEVDDVIHNVLGCMIGYGIATLAVIIVIRIKKSAIRIED